MFQKEFMLIKQVYQKNVSFVTIGFFLRYWIKFEELVFNGCHDLLKMAYSLENIATLTTKGAILSVFCGVLVQMRV